MEKIFNYQQDMKKFIDWCKDNLSINNYDSNISGHSRPLLLDFLSIGGSHIYKTATIHSDYDMKGVFILPTRHFLTLYNPVQRFHSKKAIIINNMEYDYELDELKTFFQQVLKSNINVYDEIFSPYFITSNYSLFNRVRQLVSESISLRLISTLLSMARHNYTTGKNRDIRKAKVNLIIMRCFLEAKYILSYDKIEMNMNKLLNNYTFTNKDYKFFDLFMYHKQNNIEKVSLIMADKFKDWINVAKNKIEEDIENKNFSDKLSNNIPNHIKNKISQFLYNIRTQSKKSDAFGF